uniref:Endoplasmic reticulum transmembrane protein n=1 Tax=Ciona intestinalis TaxID=7719 RepID=H2XTD6_CIOIN|nr:B-cell receptor-associated protein 31 [Ciona intestinalis]|eukprot:XP_018668627.1 B-cell receptor-associated protein 31 [Ciona intestinalis]
MSIQWTFVAGFLYAEIVVCILLCLPFVSSKRWQSILRSRLFALFVSYGNIYFMVLISILCLLFADAVREVRKYSLPDAQQVNLSNNPNAQDHVLMMLFRAQRNLYISGFALFLWLVLRRLVLLISNSATLEIQGEAFRKQAESATRTAQDLLDQAGDSNAGGDNKEKDAELEKLKEKLVEARKATAAAEASVEAMKSQAEATNAEYDRLMTEHANLQNELAGETNKKDL